MLEHCLNPVHLMNEIFRLLKDDGVLILSVPNARAIDRIYGVLRGRSPYSPLIWNLINKENLVRCSIFYDEFDINMLMNKFFKINRVSYIEQKFHDTTIFLSFLFKFATKIKPSLKEMMCVEATKLK